MYWLWKMRRKVSKENYQKTIKWSLLWEDLKKSWLILCLFAGYILIGKELGYSVCPSVMLLGIPCPGCGMTRAFFAFLRGDWKEAWHYHPFVYVLILYVIVFAFRRYIQQKEGKSMIKWLIVIGLAMILYYGYRMIRFFPTEAPMEYYYGSVLYRMIAIIR